MTQTPDDNKFPTPWRVIDVPRNIEVQQVSRNLWVLRTHTHKIALDLTGFDVFRENDPVLWEKYLKKNRLQWVRRV